MVAECESTRGEWGQPCPACGVTLPERKPVEGWTSLRDRERYPEVRIEATRKAVVRRGQKPRQ